MPQNLSTGNQIAFDDLCLGDVMEWARASPNQDRSVPGFGKFASATVWLAAADRRRYAVSK